MTENPKSRSKVMRSSIGVGAGVIAIFVLVLAPVISVSYQEPYTELETRQEAYVDIEKRTEEYTDVVVEEEAYQVRETKTEYLGGLDDYTLRPGAMRYWSAYIPEGARVTYSFSSNPTMDLYVVSQSGYSTNRNTVRENAIVMSEDKTTARDGFTTVFPGTYYFIVHNGHAGFWVIDRDVAIYSAQSTATWDEDTTKYRDVNTPVTKYREVDVPVTKYKDVQIEVTKHRDATKNITLLDSIMGKR